MKPVLIAEVGCNHQGNFEIAKKLIEAAKCSDVDVVKFQKRDIGSIPKKVRDRPYISDNSFGKTYGEHREALEFTIEEHEKLKDYCELLGVEYSCSVWDGVSAKQVAKMDTKKIKIPSACNTNYVMMEWLVYNTFFDIHVSLGMSTKDEKNRLIDKMVNLWKCQKRMVFYHCVSAYPTPFRSLYLKDISSDWIRHRIQPARVGFSGHHLGIAVDIAAYTLGATYIERHFTLDRTMKGTDHAASLEPGGMKKLRRDLDCVYEALKSSDYGVKDVEIPAREKLKNG